MESGLMNEQTENSKSNLSVEEKREIVYAISQNTENALEILQSWSRKELVELICLEMGKDRKYTGLTKPKMINQLLTIVAQNSTLENLGGRNANSPNGPKRKSIKDANEENLGAKSKRKAIKDVIGENSMGKKENNPKDSNSPHGVKRKSMMDVNGETSRGKDANSPKNLKRKSITDTNGENSKGKDANSPNDFKRKAKDANVENSRVQNAKLQGFLCENVACRARLSEGDVYCKRCSCCICCKFDENKDPSLWLVCSSDPPFTDESCGATCHLKCALKHERAGISRKSNSSSVETLDLGFYCVFCGKINSLLGCLRKQIWNAINARRVDSLCERLSLSHKILKGTENYKEMEKFVGWAATKLKKEVGPLDRVTSANIARGGIVNRLNCGGEIQKLCGSALKALDRTLGGRDLEFETDNKINNNNNNNNQPKHLDSNDFQIQFEEIMDSSIIVTLITKEPMFERNIIGCSLWRRDCKTVEFSSKTDYLVFQPETKILITGLDPSTLYFFKACPFSSKGELGVFESECKTKGMLHDSQKGSNSSLDGSNCMELVPSRPDKVNGEERYEYCVRVIRWLECENFMEREFRVKFLTWFSVKASEQERRVVSAFIDALSDDPKSLVSQLAHSFMDRVCGKEKMVVDKREFFEGLLGFRV